MSEQSDSFHVRSDRIEPVVEWLESSRALALVLPRKGNFFTVLVPAHHVGSVIASNRYLLVFYEFLDQERVSARLFEGPREIAHLERSFENGTSRFDSKHWIKQRVIDRDGAKNLERGLRRPWPERSERHWVAGVLGLHDVLWSSGEDLMNRRADMVKRFPGSILVEAGDPVIDAPRVPRVTPSRPAASPSVILDLSPPSVRAPTPPAPTPVIRPPPDETAVRRDAPANQGAPPPSVDEDEFDAALFDVLDDDPVGARTIDLDDGAVDAGTFDARKPDALDPLDALDDALDDDARSALDGDADDSFDDFVAPKRALSVLDELDAEAAPKPEPKPEPKPKPTPLGRITTGTPSGASAYAHLPLTDEFDDDDPSPAPVSAKAAVRAQTAVLCTVTKQRRALLLEDPKLVDALLEARFEESIPGFLDLGTRANELAAVLGKLERDSIESLRGTAARPIPGTQARLLDKRGVVRVAASLRRIDLEAATKACSNPDVAEDLRQLVKLYTEAAERGHAMLIAID